ncbi:Hypothetical predicted protein [Marmota monax]|uniref:Uncharacterized protein n=1 Tax=Marmota monax TaxID=9995 RepID=A0A5E4D643_MARMO|nr:Hypothetical predicted protein [Marmota monax]
MPPLVQQPILPVVKQSVKERLGPVPSTTVEPAEAQSASSDLPQVLSTSTGLTKTVYNPAALKAAQKALLVSTPAVDNNEAQKKKKKKKKKTGDTETVAGRKEKETRNFRKAH